MLAVIVPPSFRFLGIMAAIANKLTKLMNDAPLSLLVLLRLPAAASQRPLAHACRLERLAVAPRAHVRMRFREKSYFISNEKTNGLIKYYLGNRQHL